MPITPYKLFRRFYNAHSMANNSFYLWHKFVPFYLTFKK